MINVTRITDDSLSRLFQGGDRIETPVRRHISRGRIKALTALESTAAADIQTWERLPLVTRPKPAVTSSVCRAGACARSFALPARRRAFHGLSGHADRDGRFQPTDVVDPIGDAAGTARCESGQETDGLRAARREIARQPIQAISNTMRIMATITVTASDLAFLVSQELV